MEGILGLQTSMGVSNNRSVRHGCLTCMQHAGRVMNVVGRMLWWECPSWTDSFDTMGGGVVTTVCELICWKGDRFMLVLVDN